jgi:hypothetical protein
MKRWEEERKRWEERREEKRREEERRREEKERRAALSLLKLLQWVSSLMRQPCFVVSLAPWTKKRMKSVSASMPWTIAPALLVLWSVVWMFYGPFMGYPVPRDGEY